MDKKQLAAEIFQFYVSNKNNVYKNTRYLEENGISEIEEDLSDLSEVKEIIKEIEEISDSFRYHEDYISTCQPLLTRLIEIKVKLETEQNKFMVGESGYEVKHSVHIGDKEVIYAENMKADDGMFYLVGYHIQNELFSSFTEIVKCDDYLKTMQMFTERVNSQIEKVRNEIEQINLPTEIFTAEHCVPHDYSQDIDGEIVAIRSDVFRQEYRRGDNQLILVSGGHGSHGNSRGRAVFCYRLNTGEHTRFERHDVLGVVKPECIPDWAKQRVETILAEKQKEHEKRQKPEVVNGYTITDTITIGDKTFALGHNPEAVNPYVTWCKFKGREGYDWGHYFNDRDKAKEDLNNRAEEAKGLPNLIKREDRDER